MLHARPSLMLRSPKGGGLQINPSLISRARMVLSIEDESVKNEP